MAVLRLENVSKSFPGVQALDRVGFEVRAGEVHALLGENGAGKSTLIKIVSGVYQPDAGTHAARRPGGPLRDARARRSAPGSRRSIQELLLFPELSVAENIFLGHAPRTALRHDRLAARCGARAQELLASLEIHDLDVTRPVGALSVGNRQRVEIAKALSQNARILIMDEPTAALTEADVLHLFRIVRLLRARGVGIVYISHRLEEVFELADRVTVLRDGAFVGTRQVAETSPDELITMMVGRTIDNLFPKLAGRDRRAGARGARARAAGRSFHDVSLAVRAGEIVGLAGPGRLRAQRARAGDLRHPAAGRRARSCSTAGRSASRSPGAGAGASASPTCRRTAAARA